MSNCSSDGAASADSGLGPEAALGLTLSLMSVVRLTRETAPSSRPLNGPTTVALTRERDRRGGGRASSTVSDSRGDGGESARRRRRRPEAPSPTRAAGPS